ncbi:MAG: gliding motility-associated C-terminal domain-containing protein [Flavobacteriales bacterium]
MEVSSNVWTGIQSSLAAQSTAAGSAVSSGTFLAKAAAVVGITSVVALGTVNEVKQFNQDEVVEVERIIEVNEPVVDHNETAAEYSAVEKETMEAPLSTEDDVVVQNSSEVRSEKPRKVEQVVEHNEVAENRSGEVAYNPQPKALEQSPAGKSESALGQETPEAKDNETEKVAQAKVPMPAPPAEPEKEEEKQCIAYFPHAAQEWVTPNGDNNNDYFSVNGATDVSEFHIRIWTRSKQLVFESSDPNFTWYGTDLRGEPLPNRTMCFYQIDALDVNGVHYSGKNAKGSIMVITQ